MTSPASIPFDLSSIRTVFEDDWLLVVSKPAGLSVHVNREPTELNLQDLLSQGRRKPLTLFHRLDKDTSGLVILGKQAIVNAAMTQLFETKKIRKAYYAIVEGQWPKGVSKVENRIARGPNGRMVESNDGQLAVTTFRQLQTHVTKTWLEAMPKTGRTHQIRVHCALQGHPILDDRLYGKAGRTLALHAHRLDFHHPLTNKPLTIRAPLPSDWMEDHLNGFDLGDVC